MLCASRFCTGQAAQASAGIFKPCALRDLMVDGDQVHVVREREAVADLFKLEKRLPY